MSCCRRDFLKGTVGSALGCSAYTSLFLSALPAGLRQTFATDEKDVTVHTEDFARIEKLGEGVWAIISTPQGGLTTMSNGGIIAGRNDVMLIEGFYSPAGAAWAASMCRELTGRAPHYVVLTHYHYDHSNGLSGYLMDGEGPSIVSTLKTRNELLRFHGEQEGHSDEGSPIRTTGQKILLPDTLLPDDLDEHTVDLGNRTVKLIACNGHTLSDMCVELNDPPVTFGGDLIWNRMFPYYGDAIPSRLTKTCRKIMSDTKRAFVPGHGPLTHGNDAVNYIALLDLVEQEARKAIAAGRPAEQAWQDFKIPPSLGEWGLFRPDVARFAFEAWERELKP